MPVEIKVPSLGESITEAQIGRWLKKKGDRVERDESLVEVESEKASVEIPSPAAGVLLEITRREGEIVAINDVIAIIGEGSETAASKPAPAPAAPAAAKPAAPPAPAPEPVRAQPAPTSTATATMPKPTPAPVSSTQVIDAKPKAVSAIKSSEIATSYGELEEVVPMSMIRRSIARRLVEAQQTAALLTTFNEIDMSAVMQLRSEFKDTFQQQYGIKLGFMSFFVKAVVDGLKRCPELNAEIRNGNEIAYRNYYDIGVAIGGGKGLVVPILRRAELMSFAQIEHTISEFGKRAQVNKITPDELTGGTFTISNGGVYGSLLSTPIVNPPQSGILGMHTIQDRPVARNGQVVIRPMMYIALTYDHRIVDGREAVGFLKRVKEVMEEPSRMLMEI